MKSSKIYLDPLFILSYITIIFISLHASNIYFTGERNIIRIIEKTLEIISNHPLDISITTNNLKFVFIMIISLSVFWLYKISNAKNYMVGKEHGTARFATSSEAKKIADKENRNNLILTNTEKLSLNTIKNKKNLNTVIVGGSGSGKTRFYVIPNILQMNSSYVITDSKGDLLKSTGKILEESGYDVRVLNLIEMEHSYSYNPFKYLKDDKDVLKMINMIMKNTTSENHKGGEQFWLDAEKALIQAIAFYLFYEGADEEKNIPMVMEMIRSADVKEDDDEYKSPLDLLFEELALRNPEHIAWKQYQIFKQGTGKTAKSILISASVRLAVFNTNIVKRLTSIDTLDLGSIGSDKTALFIVIPDNDTTFNFFVSMVYWQLFDVLYTKAKKNGGNLPVPVNCLLDEFPNIVPIPDFEKIIATARGRNISISVILQDLSQIKSMYDKKWETVTGNADSFMFLGGNELSTLEYVSKLLGKQTINVKSYSRSRGRNSGISTNDSVLARELMTPDEVRKMPDNKCVLLVKGMNPFYSDKFKLEKHPNYNKLGEGNENEYDFTKIDTFKEVYYFEPKKVIFNSDDIEEIEYGVEYEFDGEIVS